MAAAIELKAQARTGVGKGAAREARRQGMVPAVIYGDKKTPIAISIAYKEAHKQIYAGGFLSRIITLDVDGEKHRVIPRAYQLDPVKDFPIHVDFLRVGAGTMLTVDVHVRFINEESSPGLKRGGVLNIVRHSVELSCPGDAIPEELIIDLADKDIGDTLHFSSVQALPARVTPVIRDRDFTIATIAAPSALRSDEAAATTTEAAATPAAAPAAEPKKE